MDLTECTAIFLTFFAVIGSIALIGGVVVLSQKCKAKRMRASMVPIALFCLIFTYGFSASQVTLKPCGEEDTVTRAVKKVSPTLATITPCDCGK
jgi:apolipoprotein N-acyltransferase